MGYYFYGDYIPDLGWCDGCGKGMGGNNIERYLNPRGSNCISCKNCFEKVFADRPSGLPPVTPKHLYSYSNGMSWNYDRKAVDDQYVDGATVHCSCLPDEKYTQGYTGYLDSDEAWNIFGASKCKHNSVDARTEAFKQHCEAVDTVGVISTFITRYEIMRKFVIRTSYSPSLALTYGQRKASEERRGELKCNKLWAQMFDVKEGENNKK